MNGKRKILIVDDHPAVREGLAMRIHRQPDLEVCAEASSPVEALQQIAATKPDLVIVDLVYEKGSGLDLIRDIKIRFPGVHTLVLSMQDEARYARRALQAGARGYIMKQEATERVIEAIRRILNNQIYLSEAISSQILSALAGSHTQSPPPGIEQFTDRELEVYRLLGEGLKTREIATRLHLSIKTVETYYERIKMRLKLDHHNQLVREAVLWVHRDEAPGRR